MRPFVVACWHWPASKAIGEREEMEMQKGTADLISGWIWRTAIAGVLLIYPVAGAVADAGRGLALAERWCNACHSIGNEEPRQEDAGPLFVDLAKEDAAYLEGAINRPHDFMPEFPSLSDADKASLVAYIQSLR